MQSFYKYIGWFLVLLLLHACSGPALVDKKTLLEYTNNARNGLVKEETSEAIVYSLKYKPVDLIIAQDLLVNPAYNRDSLRNLYSDCMYFTLSVSQDSSEIFSRQRGNYTELLKTLSFGLGEKIRMIKTDHKPEIYLGDFVYPRLYGSTPQASVLLCFKDKALNTAGDLTIYIKDFINNSNEELKFSFLQKDIAQTPSLKL